MVKKSLLKRASYFGSALILMLAAVVPNGRVWATNLPDSLVLDDDSNECYTIPMDKTVTLDLNGHTLSCGVTVEAGANLTITGNGTITTSSAGSAAIYNKVGGTVTVQNGTFNSTNWYTVKNLGTMIINGGAFTQGASNASNASMIANGWYNGRNGGASDQGNAYTGTLANLTINGGTFNHYTTTSTIKSDDYSKTTINGGTFTSQQGYLVQATGDVTVNGGDFTGYSSMIVFNATGEASYEPGIATINNGTVNAKYLASGGAGVLTVTGGSFTGLEKVIKSGSYITNKGISGGQFNIPVETALADGEASYRNDDGSYVVAAAPDLSALKEKIALVKVGEALSPVEDDFVRAHSTFESNYNTPDKVIIANGTFTALKPIYYTLTIKPEVYKVSGTEVVRDTQYDAKMRINAYDVTEVGNVVLPVGDVDDQSIGADTVKVAQHSSAEYGTGDADIATVDVDGKITAGTKTGSTDLYATITMTFGNKSESKQVDLGTVNVYDFSSIQDTYLIKEGGKAKILADDAWDLTATTTSQNVNIVKNGNNFRINGVSAGLAEVDFAATIGRVEKTKKTDVYVYAVNGTDVYIKKYETAGTSEIESLINKGHDDVTMQVKSIDDESIVTNEGLALTGVAAGDTNVRYRLAVGANGAHANVDINAHVWNFVTEDFADRYDLGNAKTESSVFRVYDENENVGTISYIVRDEQGNDTDQISVVPGTNANEYKIVADGAAPGQYMVEFMDTVNGEIKATKTAGVYVHQVETTGADEQYIVMTRNPFAASENRYDLQVTEHSGFTQNRKIKATVTAASSVGGVTVTYRHGGNWRITANAAGSYEVTFSDMVRIGGQDVAVASKTIRIYVLQFTFGQDSYHVVRGSEDLLINAINNYWHDINVAEGYVDTEFSVVNDETGAVVAAGFDISKKSIATSVDGEDYKFELCDADGCLPAGNYTVEFKAYANRGDAHGGKTATKSVRLHVYEMVAPQEDLYFMNTGGNLTINVFDLNERASTRAEIVSGPEGGLNFATTGWWIFQQTDYSRLVASAPGVYTVRYTDYMGDGGIVGTYEATIVVIEQEHEELFVRRGESLTLTGNTDWTASFATDSTAGVDYVAENGEIEFDTTGMELGEHIVRIAHDFTEFDDSEFPPREMVKITAVVVYDVAGNAGDDMTSDADRASVANFVADKIAEMLENNSTYDEQVSIRGSIDGLKDLLRSGANIETQLRTRLLDEDEWEDAEAADEVILKIEDESGIVAMYEAYLVIYADGNEIGLVYELDDAITMRLEIPEAYRVAADGYTRTFSVVRGHLAMDDTETAEAMDVTRDGDYLVFKNKKFSSFAISYTDNLIPVTPDTGFVASEGGSASVSSSNLVAAIVTMIGAITLAGVAIFAKRH